jgi:drug/metabolite transporter (DMT)-like permease
MESKAFLRFLAFVCLFWAGLNVYIFRDEPGSLRAFLQIFWAVLLDLAFLILLFWELFFAPKPVRRFQVFLYFTFKLVCLGFLAITLKRLRNDPPLPAAMAVLFMGVGPLLSAILAKWRVKTK